MSSWRVSSLRRMEGTWVCGPVQYRGSLEWIPGRRQNDAQPYIAADLRQLRRLIRLIETLCTLGKLCGNPRSRRPHSCCFICGRRSATNVVCVVGECHLSQARTCKTEHARSDRRYGYQSRRLFHGACLARLSRPRAWLRNCDPIYAWYWCSASGSPRNMSFLSQTHNHCFNWSQRGMPSFGPPLD